LRNIVVFESDKAYIVDKVFGGNPGKSLSRDAGSTKE
jgi:hypothetical protein